MIAVLLAGGIVKGVIGFGLPMFTIPLLTVVIAPREAVVMMSLSIIFTNVANVRLGISEWRELRHVVPYLGAAVLMIPVGVLFLHRGDPELIRFLIGLSVYGYLATRRFVPPMGALRPRARWGVGAGLGVAAGFLGGMSSIPGPVSIIYFSMFSFTKEVFVFLVNAFNTVSISVLAGALAFQGAYTPPALLQAVAALAPVLAGFWVGVRMRDRLSQELFFRMVSVGLFAIATGLILRASWLLFF
ncbi:MAG: sulfite exporter TauE/SafE family protein [bacterium]